MEQAHGIFGKGNRELSPTACEHGEWRLRTTTEPTTVRLARNVINSKESNSCWSGGTGRRTGLKNQTAGSGRVKSLSLLYSLGGLGEPRIMPLILRSTTEPLQSLRRV